VREANPRSAAPSGTGQNHAPLQLLSARIFASGKIDRAACSQNRSNVGATQTACVPRMEAPPGMVVAKTGMQIRAIGRLFRPAQTRARLPLQNMSLCPPQANAVAVRIQLAGKPCATGCHRLKAGLVALRTCPVGHGTSGEPYGRPASRAVSLGYKWRADLNGYQIQIGVAAGLQLDRPAFELKATGDYSGPQIQNLTSIFQIAWFCCGTISSAEF